MKLFLLSLGLGVAILAGCGGSSSSSGTTPKPVPTSSARAGVTFLALGDDTTVGIGSSDCGVLPSSRCPSAPGSGGSLPSVAPRGALQILAATFNLPRYVPFAFVPLGVSGALTGPAAKPTLIVAGDLISNTGQFGQVPALVSSSRSRNTKVFVVIFSGANDVLDAFYSSACTAGSGTVTGGGNASLSSPCSASGATVADASGNVRGGSLFSAYRSMLSNLGSLAGGAPEGILLVGNPDLGRIPAALQYSPAQRSQLSALSAQANLALQAAKSDFSPNGSIVVVADLAAFLSANPAYYTSAYFASDLAHFNDAGHAAVAGFLGQQYTASFSLL